MNKLNNLIKMLLFIQFAPELNWRTSSDQKCHLQHLVSKFVIIWKLNSSPLLSFSRCSNLRCSRISAKKAALVKLTPNLIYIF